MSTCMCDETCHCPYDYEEYYSTPSGQVLIERHEIYCPRHHRHLEYMHREG